jgi:hypothetical protein
MLGLVTRPPGTDREAEGEMTSLKSRRIIMVACRKLFAV